MNIIKSFIGLIFGFGRFARELRKIEKQVEGDSSLKAELADLQKRNAEFRKSVEFYCKRNPTHPICADVVENFKGNRYGNAPARIRRANAIIDFDDKGNRMVTLR